MEKNIPLVSTLIFIVMSVIFCKWLFAYEPKTDDWHNPPSMNARHIDTSLHKTCKVTLTGTILKGDEVTILKTRFERGGIMEQFYVKELNQYLYASSFDLTTWHCSTT